MGNALYEESGWKEGGGGREEKKRYVRVLKGVQDSAL